MDTGIIEEKNATINGLDISYKTIGQGMPFLILHGWLSRSDRWIKVAELISKHDFRVIVPDLPGFGKSQLPSKPWYIQNYCDFLKSFVENLSIEEFYLLGHSFGGAVAAKYAAIHSQNNDIKKLFLVGASCFREDSFRKRVLKLFAKVFNSLSFLPFYGILRRGFYKYIVGKSDYLATRGALKETYLNIIQEDLSKELGLISLSTVIIWGDRDDVMLLRLGIKTNKILLTWNAML